MNETSRKERDINMLLEFCAENFTKVPEAIRLGANRIELCDNLAGDGTTPSYGVIEQTVDYTSKNDAELAVIIRPRSGDFVYTADEFEIMKKDLTVAKVLGADGLIFGSLTEDKRIDRGQMTELITRSEKTEIVFHMAFDHIEKEHQREELDWLVKQGVTRILTHGGVGGTIKENIDWLKELIDYADGRIEILVGGGVSHENVEELAELLPTNQFHGTRIVDFGD